MKVAGGAGLAFFFLVVVENKLSAYEESFLAQASSTDCIEKNQHAVKCMKKTVQVHYYYFTASWESHRRQWKHRFSGERCFKVIYKKKKKF